MTEFIKRGNTFIPTSLEEMDLQPHLPTGNYIVKMDQYGNLFLERTTGFKLPSKVYGPPIKNANRILNTFNDRSGNTGILLEGEKGSGKTLLTKLLSIKAAEQGISTIMVNEPFCGDNFNTFIQKIDQPCIILFDEFEKTYKEKDQEKLLTLLDGVFTTKKMFILTANYTNGITEFLKNRPGRIYYSFTYGGIEEEVVREYCEENLNDKLAIDSVISYANMTKLFNFDMLVALVEEMNRYNESVKESIKFLNIKFYRDDEIKYTYKMEVDNEVISIGNIYQNPLSDNSLELCINSKSKDELYIPHHAPDPPHSVPAIYTTHKIGVSNDKDKSIYFLINRNDFVKMNNTGTELYFVTEHPTLGVVKTTFTRDFSKFKTIHDYI